MSKSIDHGLQQNDTVQNTLSVQTTICTKSANVGNRFFLKFDVGQGMVSDINLNAVTGEKHIENIFIV